MAPKMDVDEKPKKRSRSRNGLKEATENTPGKMLKVTPAKKLKVTPAAKAQVKSRAPDLKMEECDKSMKTPAKNSNSDRPQRVTEKMLQKAIKKRQKKNMVILEKREREAREAPKWPARARFFKSWTDDAAFDEVRMILSKRGWTDLGDVCNPLNTKELIDIAQCKSRGQNLGKHSLPRRCLWWVHEDDGRRLKHLPQEDMESGRHCISTFLGTNSAVTKVAITEQLRNEAFYPTSFVLPRELKEFKKSMKKKGNEYWICKPRDDFAGQGIKVYKNTQKEFEELINNEKQSEFVIQRYVPNALCIGPYKFHFRMYTILTGVLDDYEAFLYNDGHALFSTVKYDLSEKNVGDNFDILMHLTNWSQNFVKGNKYLKEDKPVIGPGCEWSVSNALKAIAKTNKKFSYERFWAEMVHLCAVTMHSIAQWKHVKRNKKENYAHPRFENFGLDVLMDTDCNIYLMEANTEVGLNSSLPNFPDEDCPEELCEKNGCVKCHKTGKNVRARENNKVIDEVVNSTINLMQLDVPFSKRVTQQLIPLRVKQTPAELAALAARVALRGSTKK